jgi:DNA-binding transcriptional ArsR family regulator
MPRKRLLNSDELVEAAECLKLLAHPQRLQLVQLLLNDRYTVGELAEQCGLPSHMTSEHLRLMQRCGFLACEKVGRFAYYGIAEPHLANLMGCLVERFQQPARTTKKEPS